MAAARAEWEETGCVDSQSGDRDCYYCIMIRKIYRVPN
jgi:hypothetical protein